MKKIGFYTIIFGTILSLFSCEKVVQVDLPAGKPLPYVDAWITDQPGVQTIRFLKAADYMDPDPPVSITDAQIRVTDLTVDSTYPFVYKDTAYHYDAGSGVIGHIGHVYKLAILYNGQSFEAYDTLKRITTIDSITYKYKDAENGDEAGYYAKFYATDLPGATDYYWIRAFRNGLRNYYALDMFSIDGSFNEGVSDGFDFIPPFREGITSGNKPYEKGDVVTVQLRSLSRPSYEFMDEAENQITNGGLFATILENVPSNLVNLDSNSDLRIYGWFGTVAQTEMSKTIQ